MAAPKQNVNYDLKEVARTSESLTESEENVTEIIETISNFETTDNPIAFDLGAMFLPEITTDVSNFGLSFGLESGFFDLATEILEISFDSAINWSGMSVSLVKMNKKIDNLQRDLDTLLKADLETAKHQLERALIRLSHNNYPGAFEEFNLILRFSEMAYPKVKGFDNKVFCKRFTIFSHRMINTFDIISQSFVPIGTLSTEKK